MTVHLTLDNKELAKAYDEISNSQFSNGRILIDKLGVQAGSSVLDIGSGTGRLGRYVSEIIGSAGSFLGIDPLEERVKLAAEKNVYPHASYRIGKAEELGPIADSSIDFIYLNAVFHWVIHKDTALREIYRVLKPGGKVGITTGARELNSLTGVHPVQEEVLGRPPYKESVKLEDSFQKQHGLTATELVQLLDTAGLKVKDVQIREILRHYPTPQSITRFFEASTFGNYLNHVPDELREQAKADIEAGLERYRTNGGYAFSGYTIFAVAQKE